MQGSIRFFVGFIIVMFAVGGVENSMDNFQLVKALAVAIVGLVIMAFGSAALKKANETN